MRLQTMAKGIELLVTLPVLGAEEGDADDVFSPQAVAVIVTAYQKMGLRDEALFSALASVVKALPAEGFDAQALANIANAYVVCDAIDGDMFGKLATIASTLTVDRWNPTALSLFANALVRAGKKMDSLDMPLLQQLADMQCEMYAAQGSRAFSSPGIMAQLLSSLVAANVQHTRLFKCASVVVAEHLRLGSPEPQSGNLLLPKVPAPPRSPPVPFPYTRVRSLARTHANLQKYAITLHYYFFSPTQPGKKNRIVAYFCRFGPVLHRPQRMHLVKHLAMHLSKHPNSPKTSLSHPSTPNHNQTPSHFLSRARARTHTCTTD